MWSYIVSICGSTSQIIKDICLGDKDVAQLVECLPRVPKVICSSMTMCKMSVLVACSCNPSM